MSSVGVLALQGDFREHSQRLAGLGEVVREVRTPEELAGISALIIPGGESTTIGRLASLYGLIEPLRAAIGGGLPVFGTCAGMIFLASGSINDQPHQLGVIDIVVERNAFGRQNESFEANIDVRGLDAPFPAVFIRAPWVAKVGADVEVLATVEEHPVMVRQDNILAASFHPELTRDDRIHQLLLDMREGA